MKTMILMPTFYRRSYVMAIGEAEAFSERMKRELVALESANVYALMETESVVQEVCEHFSLFCKCTLIICMPIGALLFFYAASASEFWLV